MKAKSNYQQRLRARRRGGSINYSLPVDEKGRVTLNRRMIARGAGGRPKMRSFSRMRRFDEV